jgi:hypothetical protein
MSILNIPSNRKPLIGISPSIYSCGVVFALALALHIISAGITLTRHSLAPHYIYLAHSMLHGQFYLDPLPPTTYDLLLYQNHWYVAGSPLPALLLVPLVALNGLAVSDILFGAILGAVNVILIYELFGQLTSVYAGFSLSMCDTTEHRIQNLRHNIVDI